MGDDPSRRLREAYDRKAGERSGRPAPAWETAERDAFLSRLLAEEKQRVLEVGAAAGADSATFAARGREVVCIDLAPRLVELCRSRGLEAREMDVSDLRFPAESFDAVYAMNCLVHVPRVRLAATLDGIARVLRAGGLFYLGLYGGRDAERIWDDDSYEPKRFFSHLTDESLRGAVEGRFEIVSFERLPHGWDGLHFQSLTLRKPAATTTGG